MKQYTIRNIPDYLDKIIREKAKKKHKSINSVIVHALENSFNDNNDIIFHDLDELAGTWIDDPETDAALEEFNKIDKELWK